MANAVASLAIIPPAVALCPRCNGTGFMCLEDYLDIKDCDGIPPVRAFGCPKCAGLGAIDEETTDGPSPSQ